jgi:hypothetical protein
MATMKLYRITYRDRQNRETDWPIIAHNASDAVRWFNRLQPEAFKITYCFPSV